MKMTRRQSVKSGKENESEDSTPSVNGKTPNKTSKSKAARGSDVETPNSKVSRNSKASKEKDEETPEPKQSRHSKAAKEKDDDTSESKQAQGKRKSAANTPDESPAKRLRQSTTPKSQAKETKKTPSKTSKNSKKPNVYEVEEIVEKRMKKGEEQFLIKWVGYPESDNSWEPKKNLNNCKELLENFLNNQG